MFPPKTVGIIGIAGKFGTALGDFFRSMGCAVIGSDSKFPDKLSNHEVVKQADVVIFSVPIKDTVQIINSVLPDVRENQLLMDVTSIKQAPVAAMLGGKSQVVGLHPMFKPDVPFSGQNMVVCPARLDNPFWKAWVTDFLAKTKAKIVWCTPEKHDKFMGPVQIVPHLANLASALVIADRDISVPESLEFASPFYRIMFSQMGRMLRQHDKNMLYGSIMLENPQTVSILDQRIKIEQRLLEIMKSGDAAALLELFDKAKNHFGAQVCAEADELFTRLIGVLSTLYGKNSVILEIAGNENQPGLLEKILKSFAERQVNLTGINSVFLGNGKRLQFAVGFAQPRDSKEVCDALEDLKGWQSPKVTVIG